MKLDSSSAALHNAALTRKIILSLGCLSGIVVVLFLVATVLAVLRVDEVSLRNETEVVAHSLEERIATVKRQQESFTDWDEVIQKVHQNDRAWITENLGVWPNKNFEWDWSVVLDERDEVIMSYRPGREQDYTISATVNKVVADFRRALVDQAVNSPRISRVAFAGVIAIDGLPTIMSVRPIQSNGNRISDKPGKVPLHIAFDILDKTSLAEIAHHARVSGLGISSQHTRSSVPVLDTNDAVISYLVWTPSAPGWETILGLVPLASIAIAITAFIVVFIVCWLIQASRVVTQKERELRRHRDHLEELVHVRTAEIATKNAELDRLLEQEREASALQRRFVSMISHEFRTPLAIIDAAAQRLTRSRMAAAPDYLTEKSVQIKTAVARMVELMESILAAGRLETGTISVDRQECSLRVLIEDCVKRRSEIAPAHRIHADLNRLPDLAFVDAQAMERVFSNLLSNAVKYAPGAPEIFIRGWQEDGSICVSVQDSGVGMDADDLPRLFQPYFRARSATGIAGTGIGLNIVREIIQLHGGTIMPHSVIGEGTTFTVRIPITGQPIEEQAA